MGSGHRLVQDQNISHKGRGIAGAQARRPGKLDNSTPAMREAGEAGNATVAERNLPHPIFPYLVKIADAFDADVAKCVLASEIETVHRLRTGSRRLQATLETMLLQAGAAGGESFEQPAKAWLRSVKTIRRAAAPVRDLDVHRKLLGQAIARWSAVAAVSARSGEENRPLGSQTEKLDEWLKDNRHARVETLKKKIKKTRQKLDQRRQACRMFLQSVPTLRFQPQRSSGLIALENFVRVLDEMPTLDAGNLHDFRKLTKKARYTAESGAEPASQSIAKAMKRVQDAIGDWHDWECLGKQAKVALGKDGNELTAWLEGEAAQFLALALSITERMRGKLLGEWMAAKSERQSGKTAPAVRKPSARVSPTRRVRATRPTSGAA